MPRPSKHVIEDPIFEVENVTVRYNDDIAIDNISLRIPRHEITALIGPSGCGKSTFLRTLNRMNDLNEEARIQGRVFYNGHDIYSSDANATSIRRQIGMVFQKPNPMPKSIYDNVAFGARINRYKHDLDELVVRSLKQAALWDEVKDKLNKSGLELSGGQQQRLCIARALATEPEVLLMDEPASALDPIATLRIESLMRKLKEDYTIIVVTHNMMQAGRVSDHTAFFSVKELDGDRHVGTLVEYDFTPTMFTRPQEQETIDYIHGKFG